MLLNELKITTDLSGEIYYTKSNGNTIKLGSFEIDPKYNHVKIDLSICTIEYEYRDPEMLKDCMGITQHMYWFKSQYVCDRYHGSNCRDDYWAIDLFSDVTPFTEEIDCYLEEFFKIAFDRAFSMSGKQTA